HGGGGDNDRAHQTHQQCDGQGSQYGIMFCGHQATPPLRRRRRLIFACMTKWSISGAHRLPNRIASMMPSGNAGLTTRISTVMTPMMIPNTHLPVLVIEADTGSVAMYTRPNARPPMVRCQYQGMANIGLVSLPMALKIPDISAVPSTTLSMMRQLAMRVSSRNAAPMAIASVEVSPMEPWMPPSAVSIQLRSTWALVKAVVVRPTL